VDGAVEAIRMEVDRMSSVEIPLRLREGEALVYEGGERAVVYSSMWHALRSLPMNPERLMLASGDHELLIDASVISGEDAHLKIELRVPGVQESVSRR